MNSTNDEFVEIGTRTIDERSRITLGKLASGITRVRLLQNARGEILMQPLVEVPASEAWVFENPEALEAVKAGLRAASEGKVSKLNVDEL
jgi:hypothetical protein